MPVNPGLVPSFRFPNNISDQEVHPEVRKAIKSAFQAFTDIYSAIPQLKSQIDANTASVAANSKAISVRSNVSSTSSTMSGAASGLGGVTNRTSVTSYPTSGSDNGTLLVLDDASAIAVTLNSGVSTPYLLFAINSGAGTATFTPSTGTVNGSANLPLTTGEGAIFFFDGTNWEAITCAVGGGGGGYSLGGAVTTANVALGAGAGSGATITAVVGLDGSHQVTITTGSSPILNGIVYTLTFSASRGHNVFPIGQCCVVSVGHTHIDLISPGGLPTSYAGYAKDVALDAGTSYSWNVSAP
jgi:hypothetical protein